MEESPAFQKFLNKVKSKGFFDGMQEGSDAFQKRYGKIVAKFRARRFPDKVAARSDEQRLGRTTSHASELWLKAQAMIGEGQMLQQPPPESPEEETTRARQRRVSHGRMLEAMRRRESVLGDGASMTVADRAKRRSRASRARARAKEKKELRREARRQSRMVQQQSQQSLLLLEEEGD